LQFWKQQQKVPQQPIQLHRSYREQHTERKAAPPTTKVPLRQAVGSLDPYPDPGGQKRPTNIKQSLKISFKCWMFSLKG
jgi:hypothetical protein